MAPPEPVVVPAPVLPALGLLPVAVPGLLVPELLPVLPLPVPVPPEPMPLPVVPVALIPTPPPAVLSGVVDGVLGIGVVVGLVVLVTGGVVVGAGVVIVVLGLLVTGSGTLSFLPQPASTANTARAIKVGMGRIAFILGVSIVVSLE